MSDDLAWDAEDFEPPKITAPKTTDKWEGEDEDDELKDNWDEDSDEEKSDKTESGTTAPKRKKKNLAQIIADKEKRQQEEAERRKQLAEEAKLAQTPEEVLAEKLRVQKIQEESDRLLAADLMGGDEDNNDDENKALDTLDLNDASSLESFRKSLITKIRSVDRLEKKPYFITFVEDLSRDLCFNLESDEIKRVTTVLNGMYNEKVKASKPVKGKKKAANKAKLNSGNNAITDSMANDFGYSEFDDFI